MMNFIETIKILNFKFVSKAKKITIDPYLKFNTFSSKSANIPSQLQYQTNSAGGAFC